MRIARVPAQAKINVFLRVGARDASGFHAVSTWLLRIDLADDVTVRVGGSTRSLDVTGRGHPGGGGLGPTERNLAFRAAVAYAERTGWPRGFAIELTKHVPVGAGLGGGSADAGAVLRALDALAPEPLGGAGLAQVAATLGSDVPFLTGEDVAAFGTGRGDRLQAVAPLPARPLVLLVPPFGVATADAYRWLDESRPTSPPRTPEPQTWLVPMDALTSWELLAETPLHTNDFESVVEARHPVLRDLRERLGAAGARIAHLAGSGSTVYGVFDEDYRAPDAAAPEALTIESRTAARVVQVEVLE